MCRIWDFHGDYYEECSLLGCGAVSEERVASIFRIEAITRERGKELDGY
jgi:hypothetical protein